jgi:phosphodiesterase/alkaline phosphatase D-like protein
MHHLAAAAVATLSTAMALPASAQLFNGVASGDVTDTSVVLWAGGEGVSFELSTDSAFGSFQTLAPGGGTGVGGVPAKAFAENLLPGTDYFYRARAADGSTATGEFTTLPAAGVRAPLRFGQLTDWQQAPPFPVVKNVADRDLDFFLKTGDTIYADLATPAINSSQARSLAEFRAKHSEITRDRLLADFGGPIVDGAPVPTFMQQVNASAPSFGTIDDHEIVDNFAGGALPGLSPDAPDIGSDTRPLFTPSNAQFVNDTVVYEDALQAYQEYHPYQTQRYGDTGDARTAGELKLYRNVRHGGTANIQVTDARSFRDAQLAEPVVNFTNPGPADVAALLSYEQQRFDPSRALFGRAQLDEMKADLSSAQDEGVLWKFVVVPEAVQTFGTPTSADRAEGYAADRTELLSHIRDNGIQNVVFLAGDFHGTVVNNVTYTDGPATTPQELFDPTRQIDSGAVEIVTGPIAFFDGRFGPNVANLGLAAGFITPEQFAFYQTLPIAPDLDDVPDDKDDFVEGILNGTADLFGNDPFGLDDNLPQVDDFAGVTGRLVEGDWVMAHNFSWTEYDIAFEQTVLADGTVAQPGELVVTTWAVDPYTDAEFLADPTAITNLEPRLLGQFVLTAVPEPTSLALLAAAGLGLIRRR